MSSDQHSDIQSNGVTVVVTCKKDVGMGDSNKHPREKHKQRCAATQWGVKWKFIGKLLGPLLNPFWNYTGYPIHCTIHSNVDSLNVCLCWQIARVIEAEVLVINTQREKHKKICAATQWGVKWKFMGKLQGPLLNPFWNYTGYTIDHRVEGVIEPAS